ncbi:DUF3693 domain-containing protein [Xanthomonas vasicola]|nr:DUF3693 domain-containing protein [Xanthomonas vasicola]MDO6947442.1 DUF3693 domain-containing protein [Xanthomonas vasicola]MDO6959648.1 DUF3693 domain-containing protein [Xanthomonas vasicola]
MGIAHGVLYEWRDGKKPVPDERIQQIAKIAGQDPGEWLLLIHSEQDQGDLGREWAKLYKRLGMAAMALVLCIGAALPGRAEAAVHHAFEANNANALYIMRNGSPGRSRSGSAAHAADRPRQALPG